MSERHSLISEDFFPDNIMINTSDIFPVAVVATMSSGKSTFVNALLGQEIMPSGNVACTARAVAILDDDHPTKEVLCATYADGNTEVIYDDIPSALKSINQDERVTDVFIRAHIDSILNTGHALLMIDTPGPNNSKTMAHEEELFKVLDKISGGMIIYLMNATQMGINDDSILLASISDYLKERPAVKIAFAINKVDELDMENGEYIPEYVHSASEYLMTMGFPDPVIVPVSSRAAMIFDKVISGDDLSNKEIMDFKKLFDIFRPTDYDMNRYAITDKCKESYKNICLAGMECDIGDIYGAIDNTGITTIERVIQRNQIMMDSRLRNSVRVKTAR